jgi:hypothetical protein
MVLRLRERVRFVDFVEIVDAKSTSQWMQPYNLGPA